MAKYGPRWSPADYTPFYLITETTHTMKEVRAEYSRMRTQLIHRVERLEAAGYHSDEYQDIGGSFTDFYTLFKSERYGA